MNLSFEFFPPKTDEGLVNLLETARVLEQFSPEYFSVTYGAGGSTQESTLKTLTALQQKGLKAFPHISCIGTTKGKIAALLEQYRSLGVRGLVVLRGDLPSGAGSTIGDFHYARDLVAFIRETTGSYFHIAVAAYPECHPQAENLQQDLRHFKAKVDAGANVAITQYFFNPDAYFRLLDDCASMGIKTPIIPGIMPIYNFSQLSRFSEMCGAEIPRYISKRMLAFGDDQQAVQEFGMEVVTRLCQNLLAGGAPSLHFYTLNKHNLITQIVHALKKPGGLK